MDTEPTGFRGEIGSLWVDGESIGEQIGDGNRIIALHNSLRPLNSKAHRSGAIPRR